MGNMENTVSVEAIVVAMENLKKTFNTNMTAESEAVNKTYSILIENGLQSARTDEIIDEIKGRITALTQEFVNIEENIYKDFGISSSDIEAAQKEMEQTLGSNI